MSKRLPYISIPSFLESGRMAGVDWTSTPLGAVETWSPNLLTAASACLHSLNPAMLCWGPQLISIYNEAFQDAFLGYSYGLGKTIQEACPKIWTQYGSVLRREVLRQPVPSFAENHSLSAQRTAPEELFPFPFYFTPAFDDAGVAGGVFNMAPGSVPQTNMAKKTEEKDLIFQKFFDSILAPMAVVNMGRQYVQVNEAYTKLTGYTLKDLQSKTLFDVTHPDDVSHNMSLLRQLEAGEIPSFIFEKRLIKKDGAQIWIKTNMTLVQDAEGQPLEIVALIEDIDKARAVEKALKATDQEFKQILDSIPHIAWTARPDGYLDYYNRRWYEYSGFEEGYSENAPVEKGYNEQKWTTILHPDDLAPCFSTWGESIRTGLPYHIEYRFIDPGKPGVYRWFLGRALPIKNEVGEVVKWFGTCTDIDDLKKIEQTARESEERFRKLAEEAPVFVWIRNAAGDLEYVNQQYIDYIGFNPLPDNPKYVNVYQAELIHPDDLERAGAAAENAYAHQTAFSVEARMKEKKTGLYNWILLKSSPRWVEGKFVGFIGTGIDISQQKSTALELEQRVAERTAELQEANRQLASSNNELEQFAYTAGHDLQEPLRKIMLFGEMLSSKGEHLSERDRMYLQKIIATSGRMSTLVQDILRFAGASRDRQPPEPVDLNEVLKNVLDDMELLIAQKKATVAREALPILQAIPIQMNQLFFNLIGNALKFSKADVPPLVEIKCRKLTPEESGRDPRLTAGLIYYEIAVSDNGVGFEEAFAEKIFAMFQRLHERSAFAGNGIGLALCRKIADNHKGAISAYSTPGQGSVFTVLLPVNL